MTVQTLYTTEVTSSGDGRNGKVRSGDGLLDTALDVELTVLLPGLSQVDAESLARDAHRRCPYSRAIRGNVDVTLRVAV